MTTSDTRRASALEGELGAMYRPVGPSADLADRIDARFTAAALANRLGRPAHARHRTLLLAACLSLMAAVALAGGVVAQRLGCGFTIDNGISFSDCIFSQPGLTNFGQPFWGTDIYDRSPAEAAEMAAEKGYTIHWQIEDRRGTESRDDDAIRFSDEPPGCGRIGGGSVVEDGRIQLVVTIDDPLMPGSEC
ncbi:MAG TPA: hypothetical protein VLA05_07625 [Coriobacteriia bacterium]|nr:hypothetical protein [Coriobacteriia bacterium]